MGDVSRVLVYFLVYCIQLTAIHRIFRTRFHFAIGQIGNAYCTGGIGAAQSDVCLIGCVIRYRQAAQQTCLIFGFFDVLLHFLLNVVQLRTINRLFGRRINRTIGHIGDGLVTCVNASVANRYGIGRALIEHQLIAIDDTAVACAGICQCHAV